jgi:hypothetical protein
MIAADKNIQAWQVSKDTINRGIFCWSASDQSARRLFASKVRWDNAVDGNP